MVIAASKQFQAVLLHGLWAKDGWQVLLVDDGLLLRPHDLSGLLVDLLAIPVGVHVVEGIRDAVVFAHEDGVEDGEAVMLIHAVIA